VEGLQSADTMQVEDIKPGVIITGPKWPEPIEIKKVDNEGSYVHIVGATVSSGQHIDQLVSVSDFASVRIRSLLTDFKGNPANVFLALETKRYRFASLYDPLLAMNTSKVDPLPHQIYPQKAKPQ